jgi:hypothetical protein
MDTRYADAINMLRDLVEQAVINCEESLSNKDMAAELRRVADELENEK